MAAQNGFTPVDIWINYNHSSTVSTIIYEEVTAEILDNLSGPDVVPGTVSVGTDITELESGNEPFEVKVNSVLVFSKLESGRYPSAGDMNRMIDMIKDVYRGAQPRRIDGV
ncbi:uncharacterized protein [Dysidea avara]|uniref:uncharacterized protein n=1 Tax=Dysidea avara TaxID=196820 RepID=UPI00331949E6